MGRRASCLVAAETNQRNKGRCVLLGKVPACRADPGSGGPAILAPDHPACPGPHILATKYP